MPVEREEFEQLCGLVVQLAEQLRKVGLGTQGLGTDGEIEELIRQVQDLRHR